MYPESSHGGDRKSIKRQSLPLDPTAPEIFGFSEANAEKVGLSARSIRLAVKIWQGLHPRVRSRLRGTTLSTKQTELKALSEQNPAMQAKILDLILGDDHPDIENVAGALAFLDAGIKLTAVERKFRSLCDGFASLPDASLDLLLVENEERVIESLKRRGRI